MAGHKKQQPAGHALIAIARRSLGRCLTLSGKYKEAETELLAAHANLEKAATPDHVAGARQSLAKLYEAWGKPAEADQWRSGH